MRRLGCHAIDRRDEQAIHPPRQQAAEAGFLPLRDVQGVREQDIVAQLVGPLLDGQDHAGEDRIGHGGDDQAEELGLRVRKPWAVESGT